MTTIKAEVTEDEQLTTPEYVKMWGDALSVGRAAMAEYSEAEKLLAQADEKFATARYLSRAARTIHRMQIENDGKTA